MTEPHDAGLKRLEAREAKRDARTEILEKIAEVAFEIREPLKNGGINLTLCGECGSFTHSDERMIHTIHCRWRRIQGLKKQLANFDQVEVILANWTGEGALTAEEIREKYLKKESEREAPS